MGITTAYHATRVPRGGRAEGRTLRPARGVALGSRVRPQRQHGPTGQRFAIGRRERLARWADPRADRAPQSQGVALGWANRRPFGPRHYHELRHYHEPSRRSRGAFTPLAAAGGSRPDVYVGSAVDPPSFSRLRQPVRPACGPPVSRPEARVQPRRTQQEPRERGWTADAEPSGPPHPA